MKSLSPLVALGKREKRDYRSFFSFILQRCATLGAVAKNVLWSLGAFFRRGFQKDLAELWGHTTSVCPRWDSFGRAFFIVWSTTVKRLQQTCLQVYLHTSHFPAPWNNLPQGYLLRGSLSPGYQFCCWLNGLPNIIFWSLNSSSPATVS